MTNIKGHQTNTGRTHFKKGMTPWNKGLKGILIPWNKGLKGYLSKERKGEGNPMFGKHHTEQARKKIGEAQTGEKNRWWKGGTKGKNNLERIKFIGTVGKKVLERDNYTCQFCSSREKLQVDHIQPWSEFVEFRFNMDNCRTLCMRCHYKLTYNRLMPKDMKIWGGGGTTYVNV